MVDPPAVSRGQCIEDCLDRINIFSPLERAILPDESARMYDDVSLFEDLSTELIREIFDYLAPHHLLDAFEHLNSRFLSIIAQHAFCLPKFDRISRQLYQYYMTYILPKYASQFRSLYLSNDPTLGAIDEFLRTIHSNLYLILTMSLRAIKIFDITEQLFQTLIDHFHQFHHIHTLLIRLHRDNAYYQQNHLYGEFYLPSILKTMPQLQSLSMYQDSLPTYTFNTSNFPTACYLHTLRMSDCSYHFLVGLLNGNHVPRLRYLRVHFSHPSSRPNEQPHIPLSHQSVPELRQIYFYLDNITTYSMLMALTDVYRHGHLAEVILDRSSCWIYVPDHLVSAQDLHRWLSLSSPNVCFFQLHSTVSRTLPPMMAEQTSLDPDLVDYQTLLNASISVSPYSDRILYGISISYPTLIKNRKMKLGKDSILLRDDSEVLDEDSIDTREIIKAKQQLMNVECFPNLQYLSFRNPEDETNTNESIQSILPFVLHIVDRAPRLERLLLYLRESQATSIATWLSEISTHDRLSSAFKRQIKDLDFTRACDNLPFLELVQILINLFADGNVENLTFGDSLSPNASLTFDIIQQGVCLLVQRLPKLIYLSIRSVSLDTFPSDCMQMTKWLSGEIEPKLARNANCRYRNRTLDFWF